MAGAVDVTRNVIDSVDDAEYAIDAVADAEVTKVVTGDSEAFLDEESAASKEIQGDAGLNRSSGK